MHEDLPSTSLGDSPDSIRQQAQRQRLTKASKKRQGDAHRGQLRTTTMGGMPKWALPFTPVPARRKTSSAARVPRVRVARTRRFPARSANSEPLSSPVLVPLDLTPWRGPVPQNAGGTPTDVVNRVGSLPRRQAPGETPRKSRVGRLCANTLPRQAFGLYVRLQLMFLTSFHSYFRRRHRGLWFGEGGSPVPALGCARSPCEESASLSRAALKDFY